MKENSHFLEIKKDIFGLKSDSFLNSPKIHKLIDENIQNKTIQLESNDNDDEIDNFTQTNKNEEYFDDEDTFELNQNEDKYLKYKIIATVKLIKDESNENENYYENILNSGISMIRFSFSIFDENNFLLLKKNVEKIKAIMKNKKLNTPLIIGIENKIMRIKCRKEEFFKKGDIAKINFSNSTYTSKKYNFTIDNYEQILSQNLTPGDKISLDFGKSLFTITKVNFKNGKVLHYDHETVINSSENKFHFENSHRENFFEKFYSSNYITNTKRLKNFANNDYMYMELLENKKEVLHQKNITLAQFLEGNINAFLKEFFQNQKISSIESVQEENLIESVEAIADFDCSVLMDRPAQIIKKIKYEKFEYIPQNYYLYLKKIIDEIKFEYLIIDSFNEQIVEMIKNSDKNIKYLAKISDLQTLKHLNLIIENSIGVVLSLNYFLKELSFTEILYFTDKLIQYFKLQGKSVIIHSHTLESLKRKYKPYNSEVNDLINFIAEGVDGIILVSETINYKIAPRAISTLKKILTDVSELIPLMYKKYPEIENQISDSNLEEVNSVVLYNTLVNDEKIVLILISNDIQFLSHFFKYTFYNQVILVTNELSIIQTFAFHAITHFIYLNDFKLEQYEDSTQQENFEDELNTKLNNDNVIQHFKTKKDSIILNVKAFKGHIIELIYIK